MFDQIARQLAPDGASDTSAAFSHHDAARASVSLEAIRSRLERELPAGPYVTDEQLSKLLKVSMKTLANRRSAHPERYPRPLNIGGSRKGLHPREDLVHWLAGEELAARTRITHRCV